MRTRLSPCVVMFFAPHLFGAPWTDRVKLQHVVGINCHAAQTSTSITKCAPTTAPLSRFPQYTLSSSDCLRERIPRPRRWGRAVSLFRPTTLPSFFDLREALETICRFKNGSLQSIWSYLGEQSDTRRLSRLKSSIH